MDTKDVLSAGNRWKFWLALKIIRISIMNPQIWKLHSCYKMRTLWGALWNWYFSQSTQPPFPNPQQQKSHFPFLDLPWSISALNTIAGRIYFFHLKLILPPFHFFSVPPRTHCLLWNLKNINVTSHYTVVPQSEACKKSFQGQIWN